jgi:hypothetical protein
MEAPFPEGWKDAARHRWAMDRWTPKFGVLVACGQVKRPQFESDTGFLRERAASIPVEGRPPARVGLLLPRKGLDAARVRAFHDHLELRHHLPPLRENPHLLDRETEVVLAPRGEPAPERQLLAKDLLVVAGFQAHA